MVLIVAALAVYYSDMVNNHRKSLSSVLKQQRISLSLTVQEVAINSGVSASHLGRIERGERFPSAHILRRLAKPLGFDENELFMLAGFLSHRSPMISGNDPDCSGEHLDPYVAGVLSQEPAEVQRTVIGILSILRSLTKSTKNE